MAETITKVHYVYVKDEATGKKTRITKTKEYRIDPEFVPASIKDICSEFVMNYCISKGEATTKWLKDKYDSVETTVITNKDGKEETRYKRKFNDREIIVQFTREYFPDIIKEDKEKNYEPKRTERIAKLEQALKKYQTPKAEETVEE